MKKHIDCGDPVDLLVRDYDDGLPILKLYRQQNPGIELSVAKWTVEDVPCYVASDLRREEAEELAGELTQLGTDVEIIG